MYFAVMKLTFESSPGTDRDLKDAHALVERLRKRFKVSAQPMVGDATTISIAVAALHGDQNELTKKLDAIIDLCETSGFGRVSTEETLLDHIDALSDYDEHEGSVT